MLKDIPCNSLSNLITWRSCHNSKIPFVGERGGAEQHPEREYKSWRPAAAPPHYYTERYLGTFSSPVFRRLASRDAVSIRFTLEFWKFLGSDSAKRPFW